MESWPIRNYELHWHPGENRGRVLLDVDDDPEPDLQFAVEAGEMAALARLLALPNVAFFEDGSVRVRGDGRAPEAD